MKKKLAAWKGGSLSIAGRTTLINANLSSSFIYHMSMYLLPKTITKKLDGQRRSFFWQGGSQKRKYHLVRWTTICKSKRKGGLGIKDIRKMNISFLCKWWWKLENEKGLWQQIIQQKYLSHDLTSIVKGKNDDSPIWKDLLKVRLVYLKGRKIKTGRGDRTLFWLDPWLTQQPLCTLYPVLFDLCDMKKCTVLDFLTINGQLHFSRWLPPFSLSNGWGWSIRLSLTPLKMNKTKLYGNGMQKALLQNQYMIN